MKKKQKLVTVFVVLLFCVLARASDGGDCLNSSVSDRNTCLRTQGDEAYNRAVDYFTRGVSYVDSNDSGRAFAQLNLSKMALLEANSSFNSMDPVDSQLTARVAAAYLQVEEKMSDAAGNTSQPTAVKSSKSSSSTTLMAKVSTLPETAIQQASPSGNQILLAAAAILLLSVVGVLVLKKRK